jgi:GNAT superfamily N-acetyltransferase
MGDDVEIRPAKPEDRAPILELMRLSLGVGQIPRSTDFWSWKHESNPFGRSPVLLATAGDQLVGLRVFMRWNWREGSNTWRAARAVDTATHPAWRGKGLFTRLTLNMLQRMRDEGVDFIFNTPNELSRPGYLKMGWKEVGRLSMWVRPLRPRSVLAAFMDRSTLEGGDAQDVGKGGVESQGPLSQESRLEAFLESLILPRGRLSTTRTRGYVRWRYEKVPGIRYQASWQVEGTTGAALVFRHKPRGKLVELRLCEILVGPDGRSHRIARRLVRRLIAQSGADFAAAMTVTGASASTVLAPLGFLPVPRLGPVMTSFPLAAPGHGIDPLRKSSWHVSIGDLELF